MVKLQNNFKKKEMVFALYFGNRGFFPETLIASARKEMKKAVKDAGYKSIIMDENTTRYGAVESNHEGKVYAKWLEDRKGDYDGIILCLPNFGDEDGAIAALRDCGKPILIQAYPDEVGKMDFAHRRDSFCGKFSIEDVFHQYQLPFTALKPHVVHPLTPEFEKNLNDFAAICRIVNGMRRFSIGAIGARTTKFKTVRYDEITLQKYGITVETFDLSELIYQVGLIKDGDPRVIEKRALFENYADFSLVPDKKTNTLAKASIVIDDYINKYDLDCITLRCWDEMQKILGVAPCVILSQLNDKGIIASCEIDLCSAITMYALQLASEMPTACLDWNNNYDDDPNKVILFHCGPVANSLMSGKGQVTDHKMFAKIEKNSGWGSNEGRISSFPFTYSNCKTEDGKLTVYFDEGEISDDIIEKEFFGCAGVAKIKNLQDKLILLGQNGYRHHTTIGVGHIAGVLCESFKYYLGYEIFWLDNI